MLYALEESGMIEDYYEVWDFVGVFSTELKAKEHSDSLIEKRLRDAWVLYATHSESSRLSELHRAELDRLDCTVRVLRGRQPKYYGSQKDKDALTAHHNTKWAWRQSLNAAQKERDDFYFDNVANLARDYALSVADSMPADKKEEVERYAGRPPSFRITPVEVDAPL